MLLLAVFGGVLHKECAVSFYWDGGVGLCVAWYSGWTDGVAVVLFNNNNNKNNSDNNN